MIDGIKTGCLPLDVYRLADTQNVDITPQTVYTNVQGLTFGFIDRIDTNTGEIRKLCTLRGSLHKYANEGRHNADSFRMSDLCRVFTELKEVYSINPDTTRIQSVEFGVNIKLPYDPRRILKAVRMYKGFAFVPMNEIGLCYRADSYKLKIYDKGRQCGVAGFENILRIEVQATTTYLKKRHVYAPTLGDLLSAHIWERFEAILLDMIDNTVIVEAAPVEALTRKEQKLFALFTGDGWRLLDKVKRCRAKKRFLALAEHIGATTIKEDLKKIVLKECRSLRDLNYKKCNPNGVLQSGNEAQKVNDSNNICHKDNIRSATETAFFPSAPKDEKCNRNGFKIKGVLVAHCPPETPPPQSLYNPHLFHSKISGTDKSVIKSRGKPPDVRRITPVRLPHLKTSFYNINTFST